MYEILLLPPLFSLQLYYQHQVVQELRELWDKLVNSPPTLYVEEKTRSFAVTEASSKSTAEITLVEEIDSCKSSSLGKRSLLAVISGTLSEAGAEPEDVKRVEWNLSIPELTEVHACSVIIICHNLRLFLA